MAVAAPMVAARTRIAVPKYPGRRLSERSACVTVEPLVNLLQVQYTIGPHDQRGRDPHAAVRRAFLSGVINGQRHRQARPIRGPELRGTSATGSRRAQEGAAGRHTLQSELGPPRK